MMIRKIKSIKAFTLAEALVAMLILLMVASIVTAGIPVAKNAYEDVIVRANAEIVMSTAVSALRNELSVARDVSVSSDGKTVSYYSGTYGSASKIILGGADGIMYQRYSALPIEEGNGAVEPFTSDPVLLVSESASDNLRVSCSRATYDEDKRIIKFSGLSIEKNGKSVVSQDDLAIATF
ncbi:MAG: hypothetical protein IJI20_03140 [Firmicutes bacterium]|nr:hypothetical protein [Bacillota bacterium]